jgi:N-acetylglucosamine-6-phosphate deacetylase
LFDIQVNGAFGVDFNDDILTLDAFQFACAKLQATGVSLFLPTIITAPVETMGARIRKIVSFIEQESTLGSLVAGLHVEGPFISRLSGYRGTHPEHAILDAQLDVAKRLIDSGRGHIRMLTLAPEADYQFKTTEYLTNQSVVVFGGHSNATFDCLNQAIEHGLKGFTHLGNGCALEVNRHENIISRVLALRKKMYVSLIADGIHLPYWLLRSFVEIIGSENVIITSDSMSAAGMPPGEYQISGQPIIVDEDRRTRHRDHRSKVGSVSRCSQDAEHPACPPIARNRSRLADKNRPIQGFACNLFTRLDQISALLPSRSKIPSNSFDTDAFPLRIVRLV